MTEHAAGHRTLGELLQEGDIAMLTTCVDGQLSSRPIAIAGVHEDAVLFLVDGESSWVAALPNDRRANAAIRTRLEDWVSVSGVVKLTDSPEAITALWTPSASAYFDGPADQRLRVLVLALDSGEYWTTPGDGPLGRFVAAVGSALGLAASADQRGRVVSDGAARRYVT